LNMGRGGTFRILSKMPDDIGRSQARDADCIGGVKSPFFSFLDMGRSTIRTK
jgi:hypothetical protein